MANPIRSLADFTRYAVNRADQMEVVRQTLYDFQAYPMAGAAQLTFFAVPVGQGAPVKTLADTNMVVAGQLPAPIRFAIQCVEVYFDPGVFPSPAVGTVAANGLDNHVNDIWEVYTSPSWLQLDIGSKPYLKEAPLYRFPPTGHMGGCAQSSQAGAVADTAIRTSHMYAAGRPFVIDPPLLLEPNQNFSVTLNFPALVAISAAGRIGVVLGGVTARNSQ
jgi:hypothetical protein